MDWKTYGLPEPTAERIDNALSWVAQWADAAACVDRDIPTAAHHPDCAVLRIVRDSLDLAGRADPELSGHLCLCAAAVQRSPEFANAYASGILKVRAGCFTGPDLYRIDCGGGVTCLGFDNCLGQIRDYAAELGIDAPAPERGTVLAYALNRALSDGLRQRFERTGKRATCGLTAQLIGLEGKRVEVKDAHGEVRRFKVGKSTGWIPCHLELANRRSSGGGSVTGAPFQSVRVIS